jgi:hypothetical protein
MLPGGGTTGSGPAELLDPHPLDLIWRAHAHGVDVRVHPVTKRSVRNRGLPAADDGDPFVGLAGRVNRRTLVIAVLRFDPQPPRSLEALEQFVRVAVEADDHRDWVGHSIPRISDGLDNVAAGGCERGGHGRGGGVEGDEEDADPGATSGGVVSSEQLLARVWDENVDPFTSVVRVVVMTLRRKLGDPALIETVTGAG